MWRRMISWLIRLLYLGALAGLFVIAAYVSFSQFIRRGVTPVPSVMGLELDDAERTLADHGLKLRHREEDDRFAEDVEPGMVLEQRPKAGNLAKRGGLVEVVLSRGKRLVVVPDLTGKALPAAQVTLAAVGLSLESTAHVFSDGGSVGTVVSQLPAAGTELDRGAGIKLFLVAESLADTYVMPDLVDRDYREVRHFLNYHGFRVGSVKFEPYEGVSETVVLRQFPLPGHPLRRGEVISLVVAVVPGAEAIAEEGA